MKEAGLSGGISVKYLGLPQYPELLKTGEVVKEQLAKIGIDMAIQQVDVSVWFDHFSKGTYQITSAYQERTLDPDNFYSLVLKGGAAINASGYKNPAVDKLIEQAAGDHEHGQAQGALLEDPQAGARATRRSSSRTTRRSTTRCARTSPARRSTRRSSCGSPT